MRARRSQPGFTLMEVLVATALTGIVMALAMAGFAQVQKISSMTQSRSVGRDVANLAIQKLAPLFKRASIIFFTGMPLNDQPLDNFGVNVSGNLKDSAMPRGALPPFLLNTVPGGRVKYQFGLSSPLVNLTTPISSWPSPNNMQLSQFRFWDDSPSAGAGGVNFLGGGGSANAYRLRTANPNAATDFDTYFPSPLAYFAEANFDDRDVGAVGTSTLIASNIPLSWNIYVLYLAPMNITNPHDALVPVSGASNAATRDLAKSSGATPTWARSTIPLELHLFTAPFVPAAAVTGGVAQQWNALTPYGLNLSPSDPANPQIAIAPFEYTKNKCNFDPLPLDVSGYRTFLQNSPAGYWPASYGRVDGEAGNNIHSNFSNIGNDPPDDAVFTKADTFYSTLTPGQPGINNGQSLGNSLAGAPTRCSDVVIARYIDPDDVHGTCVRLNNPTATAAVRPYYNAYTTLHDTTGGSGAAPDDRGYLYRSGLGAPSRIFLSVATRYRSSNSVPFQFATSSVELDLEQLNRYQMSCANRSKPQ